MKKTIAYSKNFIGTNYEIGQEIAQWVSKTPALLEKVLLPQNVFPKDKMKKIQELLESFDKGINEEIKGFSDFLGIKEEQVLFYAITYLERGCSILGVGKNKTASKHTLLARNYDFNDEMEEMCFAYTKVKGKYAHISSLLNLFGRCDGMNEHGLAVCKASNGIPIGNFSGGMTPEVTGISFWVVVRNLLEHAQNTSEALEILFDMPIAYNMNMLISDQDDTIVLFEVINGKKGYELFAKDDIIYATNHTVINDLKKYEKVILENSLDRYEIIKKFFEKNEIINENSLEKLLSDKFPSGLCMQYYEDFFGTLRSMIFDVTAKKIRFVWGSGYENKWEEYDVAPLKECEVEINLPSIRATKDFYKIQKVEG